MYRKQVMSYRWSISKCTFVYASCDSLLVDYRRTNVNWDASGHGNIAASQWWSLSSQVQWRWLWMELRARMDLLQFYRWPSLIFVDARYGCPRSAPTPDKQNGLARLPWTNLINWLVNRDPAFLVDEPLQICLILVFLLSGGLLLFYQVERPYGRAEHAKHLRPS